MLVLFPDRLLHQRILAATQSQETEMQLGKVLVTGASGFIGKALTARLQKDGHDVRALVRDRKKISAMNGSVLDVIEGDITDPTSVDRAASGIETVFHIAGAFREPGLSDQQYTDVNVEGTRNVLDAALRHGARRVVHCSTSGIHGSISGPPGNEEHRLVLDEVYERTKAEGEIAAIRFGEEHDLEVTALRPTQVYGPGDTRLLKLFKMVNSKVTLWFGPGTARYHLLYIEDLVDAFVLAAGKEAATGQSFLIGGPQLPSLNELMKAAATAMGKEKMRVVRLPVGPFMLLGSVCEQVCVPLGISPPIYRRRMEFFVKDKAHDISKARDLLGYSPQVSMDEGLERTVQWYRESGML